ncbi:MAG: hypothetical protein H0U39_00805 [Segetibacter sp.]|nr:hypothetical protein [Segetibacter sp.]
MQWRDFKSRFRYFKDVGRHCDEEERRRSNPFAENRLRSWQEIALPSYARRASDDCTYDRSEKLKYAPSYLHNILVKLLIR